MKKIAIIGANEAINNLIVTAKQNGYETHVFAWESGAPGEKSADFFYPISIADKENILEKCKQIKPDGIVSITSDYAVNTVNYVARQLGLVGNSERTDLVARNKYEMRCALRDAGLYVPWFRRITDEEPLSLHEVPAYPVIVKPTDMWSSRGVSCARCQEDLQQAINTARKVSMHNECIVEGFIDGSEYSCESISFNGKHTVLAFTKKRTTGYPHYIETGHNQPSDIPEEQFGKLYQTIYRVLDAMDIKNGASHVEFRIRPNGEPAIIEVGARMGGDCIGTHLVRLSTGMDFVKMVLDVSCGIAPDFTAVSKPKKACVRFILTEEDYRSLQKRRENDPESLVFVSAIEKVGSREVIDSSTRFGYYVYTEE